MSKPAAKLTVDELDFIDKSEAEAYYHVAEPALDKYVWWNIHHYSVDGKRVLVEKAELKKFIKTKCLIYKPHETSN